MWWWLVGIWVGSWNFFSYNVRGLVKVRKTTRRGGWIVFLETSSFTFYRTVLRFRVWVSSESLQRINVKNRRRKNTGNYTGSFHKPEIVLSPLHFQGEFHKNVISNYKLLNHTRKRLIFAQGQLQETSMLNHNWKRLLCSRTTPRDFLFSITTERDF